MPLISLHITQMSFVFLPNSAFVFKALFPMGNGWFSIIGNTVLLCRAAVCSWVLTKLGGSETEFLVRLMKKTAVAVLTCSVALGKQSSFGLALLFSVCCILASGGATVGTISGAIKGQTTETGFLRGAGIGALTGAITAVQLMELTAHGESFSKVALLFSLLNGKVFREWVTPAVLKAYQWQTSTLEASFNESLDIFEINGGRGLSQDYIKKLPQYKFSTNSRNRADNAASCIICLEDFKNGDMIRGLPSCGHSFHLRCIDEWLITLGSCPVCRKDV